MNPDDNREEYLLPCASNELRSGAEPTAWIERFAGLDVDEVHRVLAADWAGIRHPSVVKFRDAILQKYRPFALRATECAGTSELVSRRGITKTHFSFESPPERQILESALASHDLTERELIREFYAHFYGMRNRVGYPASRFLRPEKWELFESLGWHEEIEEFDPNRDWARAIIVYFASDGNSVILKPDGEAAWAVHTHRRVTGPFVPIAPSFAVVLEQFVDLADPYFMLDYYTWEEMWRD